MTPELREPSNDPVEIGEAASPVLPRSYYKDPRGRLRNNLTRDELVNALGQAEGRLWVAFDTRNESELTLLEELFHFHHLSIEDVRNPSSRVKVEEFSDYLFIVVRVVRFCETTPDPYDLETFNLNLFIGPNFLVTAHGEESGSIAAVEKLVSRNPDLFERGVARLAHMILDMSIDAYFPILDRLDDFIDGLEARVFEKFDNSVLHEIFSVKRMVISLRRYLAPQRESFNILTNRPTKFIPVETQLYFRDIYDHVLRINDSLENYRELMSSTLDSYLTQVSNRVATVTKGLSIVATMSVPFVVIAGIYGMNFSQIPLADHPYGFWILVALQFVVGFALVGFLRLRGWL